MKQAWKDKYILHWYPTSGAFGGSVSEIKLYASGDNEGITGVKGITLRDEQRSYQTNFWLLPDTSVFKDQVLAMTPSKNYTAADYKQFWADIDFPTGSKQLGLIRELTPNLPAPNVDVTHLYGTGMPTGETYVWAKDNDFTAVPKTIMGPGDGTVNLVALQAVDKWATSQLPYTFKAQTFAGQSHTGILQDAAYIRMIAGFVSSSHQDDGGDAAAATPTLPPTTSAPITSTSSSSLSSCNACITKSVSVWCWKDQSCHDEGSLFNPCSSSQCVSQSSLSECKCSVCSSSSCGAVGVSSSATTKQDEHDEGSSASSAVPAVLGATCGVLAVAGVATLLAKRRADMQATDMQVNLLSRDSLSAEDANSEYGRL